MNRACESCAENRMDLQEQSARMVEYEKKLQKSARQPVLAAMFILYFLISASFLGLIGYWLFR